VGGGGGGGGGAGARGGTTPGNPAPSGETYPVEFIGWISVER